MMRTYTIALLSALHLIVSPAHVRYHFHHMQVFFFPPSMRLSTSFSGIGSHSCYLAVSPLFTVRVISEAIFFATLPNRPTLRIFSALEFLVMELQRQE